jgi:predicted nucleotidyltransferase
MSILAKLFSSRTRAEVFKILFGLETKEVHLREIARRSKLTIGTIQDELRKLRSLDLITIRRDGNRLYYRANASHPLFTTLRGLVLKTDGLAERLRVRLACPEIETAFVYGSLAKGEETGGSDLDIFVIGSLSIRSLTPRLAGLAEEIGREINPFVITAEELRKRLSLGDHFIAQVWESPKIFVVGGENDLESMGGKRLA